MFDAELARRMIRERALTASSLPQIFAWENRQFCPPENNLPWMRESMSIISENRVAVEMIQVEGRTTFAVFVPTGVGTEQLGEFTRSITEVFQRGLTIRTLHEIDTGCPIQVWRAARSIARKDFVSNSWYFQNVDINWRAFVSAPFSN